MARPDQTVNCQSHVPSSSIRAIFNARHEAGFVLAPSIYGIFFSILLRHATGDMNDEVGVHTWYCHDGNHLNSRRLQAHTMSQETMILDLLLADNAALVAHTELSLQRITSCFADSSWLFGLEVRLGKTDVLRQRVPQEEYQSTYSTIVDSEQK